MLIWAVLEKSVEKDLRVSKNHVVKIDQKSDAEWWVGLHSERMANAQERD